MPELVFKGKIHVANHHLVVPYHELVAVKSKGLAKTPSLHDNILLHGDNLLALKALLPTHSGKVKCIYIDPPYNTGNEGWAYNDKVNSPLMRDWLGKTIDREDLTRHDKWCSMMLPRLKLLRELLTEDGVIFVSIDDNEVHHLRCLMDEVFGEENFVANVVWRSSDSSNNDAKQFSVDHNHTLVYSKLEEWRPLQLARTDDNNAHYKNPDNDPNGPWFAGNLSSPNPRENLRYAVKSPKGFEIEPPSNGWRWKRETLQEMIEEGRIVFSADGTKLMRKTYLKDQIGLGPSNLWADLDETGHNRNAKYELKKIFPELETADVFRTPKPIKFLQKILQLATDKDSLILDSFAGSGTTGHAVLKQNAEDGGTRRFVLIETEDYADKTTAERIRRCVNGVPTAKDETLREGYGGTFSFFKLGGAVALQTILESKDLPSYDALAAYVFFTSTGEQFDPRAVKPKIGFIGRSRIYDVYLLYTPNIEALKDLALDLPTVRALPVVKGGKERKRLVFAPTRFMDDALLHQHGIVFSQLPYEIYERVEKPLR